MAIQTTARGILDFLQGNDGLVKDIGDTAKDAGALIKKLADRVEAGRTEAQNLVDRLGNVPFDVAPTPDIRARQTQILDSIEDTSKKIQEFRGFPEITAALLATRATLYVALANTYNDAIRKTVPFTADEVAALRSCCEAPRWTRRLDNGGRTSSTPPSSSPSSDCEWPSRSPPPEPGRHKMSELPKRQLGRTGLQVTMLGYGAMELRGAPRGRDVSDQQAETILNAVLDSGITYIVGSSPRAS